MNEYFDDSRTPIQLGQRLGRGGEGTAYLVANRPATAAKLYDIPGRPITADTIAKLEALIGVANHDVLAHAAWPQSKIWNAQGQVCGFSMPAIRGHHPLHELIASKSRKQHFGHADWRFLVHASVNLARAFGAVQSTGAVVADVNGQNILVAADATVKVIDCDSFQLHAGGRLFRCIVATDDYTPPELQSSDFHRVDRTQDHDNFGLAVLLFQLLMMGRHPFDGVENQPGDGQRASKIAAGRFGFGPRASSRGMTPPPGSLPHDVLGPDLWPLFESAFTKCIGDAPRPTAKDWLAALNGFAKNLRACSSRPEHWYFAALKSCPWCRLESSGASGGTHVFFLPKAVPLVPNFDPEKALAAAKAVVPLAPVGERIEVPMRPPPPPSVSTAALDRWSAACWLIAAATAMVAITGLGFLWFGLAALLFAVAIRGRRFVADRLTEQQKRSGDVYKRICIPYDEAERLHANWLTPPAAAQFEQLLRDLGRSRDAMLSREQTRKQRLNVLAGHKRPQLLQRHLESQRIAPGAIPMIGDDRSATLAHYGVRTAADVDSHRILRIPGFGPTLAGNVVTWRRQVEAQFRFDPLTALAGYEIQRLDADLDRECLDHQRRLASGPDELRRLAATARVQRDTCRAALVAAIERIIAA